MNHFKHLLFFKCLVWCGNIRNTWESLMVSHGWLFQKVCSLGPELYYIIHTSNSIQALPEGCTAEHLLHVHCACAGLGAAAAPVGMHGQNQIEEPLTYSKARHASFQSLAGKKPMCGLSILRRLLAILSGLWIFTITRVIQHETILLISSVSSIMWILSKAHIVQAKSETSESLHMQNMYLLSCLFMTEYVGHYFFIFLIRLAD